jgi:hypothetical protein
MKTYKKPVANNLVSRFDKELMNILMSDLKLIRVKNLIRALK